MPDYDFRPGGSLKLKKSSTVTDGGVQKKKKKGKAKRKNTEDELARASSADVEEGPSSKSNKSIADEPKVDNMTEAERRFEEIRRRRMDERVKQLAKQTHKDRVHDFNAKLEALSEHHDIPKVGPG